jgi:hypothetical protein
LPGKPIPGSTQTLATNANKLKELLEKCSKAENLPLNTAHVEKPELKAVLRKKYPYLTKNSETPKKRALSAYTQILFEKVKNKTM